MSDVGLARAPRWVRLIISICWAPVWLYLIVRAAMETRDDD